MKVIKMQSNVTVVFSDGRIMTKSDCTQEMYESIMNNLDDEEYVYCLLCPEFCSKKEEIEEKTMLLEQYSNSNYMTVAGNSVYIKSISELTLPEDFAKAFYLAEQEDNEELVQSYLNFWTLCSLNPDSRARTNLFWFLNRYGMRISKSGLFVGYRNVLLKKDGSEISTKLAEFIADSYTRIKYKHKKSPSNYIVYQKLGCVSEELKNKFEIAAKGKLPEFQCYKFLDTLDVLYKKLSDAKISPVYTDAYTQSFTIKIGEPVSIDRSQCDGNQENSCSKGLHCASQSWLEAGYFGNISMMCLVNPAEVVAIPTIDDYGKMRVCRYYPVKIVERNEEGKIVNDELEDGFEDDFMNEIFYSGDVNNKDELTFTVDIPEIPEINKQQMIENLASISLTLNSKYVN